MAGSTGNRIGGAKILFGVEGGSSLNQGSGKLIADQLNTLVSNLNQKPYELAFKASEKSLSSMKSDIEARAQDIKIDVAPTIKSPETAVRGLSSFENKIKKVAALEKELGKSGTNLFKGYAATASDISGISNIEEAARKSLSAIQKLSTGIKQLNSSPEDYAYSDSKLEDAYNRAANAGRTKEWIFSERSKLVAELQSEVGRGIAIYENLGSKSGKAFKTAFDAAVSGTGVVDGPVENQLEEEFQRSIKIVLDTLPREVQQAYAEINSLLRQRTGDGLSYMSFFGGEPIEENLKQEFQDIIEKSGESLPESSSAATVDVAPAPDAQAKLQADIGEMVKQLQTEPIPLKFTVDPTSIETIRTALQESVQVTVSAGASGDAASSAEQQVQDNKEIADAVHNVNAEKIEQLRLDREIAETSKAQAEAAVAQSQQRRAERAESRQAANEAKADAKRAQKEAEKYTRKLNSSSMREADRLAYSEGKYVSSPAFAKIDQSLEAMQNYMLAYNRLVGLNDSLKGVDTARYSGGDYKMTEQETAAVNQLAEAIENLKNARAALAKDSGEAKAVDASALTYDKLTNKLIAYEQKFHNTMSQNPEIMAKYQSLLNQFSTREFGSNMTQATSALQQFQIEVHQVGADTETIGQTIKRVFSDKFGYGVMAGIALASRQALKAVYANVKEIDSGMTQLKIVTGATDKQMSKFFKSASAQAKELGKSITDVLKNIETFSRLGYNLADATELSKYASILSNTAAVGTDEATTGLTSIIKGYNLDVSQAEHVADVLIEVGQKYAISAGELMDAFQRGGAALNASGTSFEKSAALFAAGNAAMQDADVVGTAIKSVSARIRGSTSELESLGESTEDIAEGFSKYRDELKALTNVSGKGGFDIMADADAGKYKDIYDIFVGISEVWDKLSDTSQARVAEILGGTRQLSVISSIIENISDATGAYDAALNSANVSASANAEYMDSIDAKLGQTSAIFQDISENVLDSGVVKFGLDALNIVLRLVDGVSELNLLLPAVTAGFSFFKTLGGPEYEGFPSCAQIHSGGNAERAGIVIVMSVRECWQNRRTWSFMTA